MRGKRKLKKSAINIIIGSVLYGMSISLFLDPNNLAPGGVTGIAIIINRITGIGTGFLTLLMNIPLILIGVYKFGLRFLLTTIVAILGTSVSIEIFSYFPKASGDVLVSAIMGGALVAVSVGLIFKIGATTGGTDIAVRLIKLKYPHLKTGYAFMLIDMTIVAASIFVFKEIDIALYAGIAVVVCSVVLDMILYGSDEAKLIYVISKNKQTEKKIVLQFLEKMGAGATFLSGYGAYSGKNRSVIMCAIKKTQLPLAKDIVRDIDDDAFMIVTSANEILGEGYKSHHIKGF